MGFKVSTMIALLTMILCQYAYCWMAQISHEKVKDISRISGIQGHLEAWIQQIVEKVDQFKTKGDGCKSGTYRITHSCELYKGDMALMRFQKGLTWRTINVRILNKEKWRACSDPKLTVTSLCQPLKIEGSHKLSKNTRKKKRPDGFIKKMNGITYIAGSSIYPYIIYGYLPVENALGSLVIVDVKKHRHSDYYLDRSHFDVFKDVVTRGLTTGPCGSKKFCVYICRKCTTSGGRSFYKISRLVEPDGTSKQKVKRKYRIADLRNMESMSISSISMDNDHFLYVLAKFEEKMIVRKFKVEETKSLDIVFQKRKDSLLSFSPSRLDVAKDGLNFLVVKDDGVFRFASWELLGKGPFSEKYLKEVRRTVDDVHVTWICMKRRFVILKKPADLQNYYLH